MQKNEYSGALRFRTVQQFEEARRPQAIAIFCHGFGASGSDLVPVWEDLCRCRPELTDQVQFVFPEALLSLDDRGLYGGRAWWNLDVNQLVEAVSRGETRRLRKEFPAGLPDARAALTDLVALLSGRTGLPLSRIVLGGFSQGAMLATDVALHLPGRIGGLVVWSGTLLCEDDWRPLAARRGPLPVFQSHGEYDPILPFEGAQGLREMFEESGQAVDFYGFPGQHQLTMETVAGAAALIAAALPEEQSGRPITRE